MQRLYKSLNIGVFKLQLQAQASCARVTTRVHTLINFASSNSTWAHQHCSLRRRARQIHTQAEAEER